MFEEEGPFTKRAPRLLALALAGKQIIGKRGAVHFEVCRNIAEDSAQRSHLERVMGGDGDVVLSGLDCRSQPKMASGLARNLVPVAAEHPG